MFRLVWAGALPVVFLVASGARAAETLSESEFLAGLEADHHPAVAASLEAAAVADAHVLDAETLSNPTLSVEREDPSGPGAQTDVMVSWSLPGRARRLAIASRRASSRAEAARAVDEQQGVHLAMRAVFARWALATARADWLATQAARVRALAAREATRADRGESSGLAFRRLALAAAAVDARLVMAEVDREQARVEAAHWVPTLPADARPALPTITATTSLATDASTDAAMHVRIAAAEADVVASQLNRDAARRLLSFPDLSLGWTRQSFDAGAVDGPRFGVSWSVPLFDRNRARQAAADARIMGAEARLEHARHEVETGRAAARVAHERLAKALEDAADALAVAEDMLDSAEAAFRLGELSLTDLLDAHRSVTEAALNHLDILARALAAERVLERLHPEPKATP